MTLNMQQRTGLAFENIVNVDKRGDDLARNLGITGPPKRSHLRQTIQVFEQSDVYQQQVGSFAKWLLQDVVLLPPSRSPTVQGPIGGDLLSAMWDRTFIDKPLPNLPIWILGPKKLGVPLLSRFKQCFVEAGCRLAEEVHCGGSHLTVENTHTPGFRMGQDPKTTVKRDTLPYTYHIGEIKGSGNVHCFGDHQDYRDQRIAKEPPKDLDP